MEWPLPEKVDSRWIERIREDYPDATADLTDERLIELYNPTGGKYAVTWDHLGDAYEQFERVVDMYYQLKEKVTP